MKCTVSACDCGNFSVSESYPRRCKTCHHGWVSHMDNISISDCNTDPAALASLILNGAKAIPIRLKILLDYLLIDVSDDVIVQILEKYGWTLNDFGRGYIMHNALEGSFMNWSLANRSEESIIIHQFLKCSKTNKIAEHLLKSFALDLKENNALFSEVECIESKSIKTLSAISKLSLPSISKMPNDQNSKGPRKLESHSVNVNAADLTSSSQIISKLDAHDSSFLITESDRDYKNYEIGINNAQTEEEEITTIFFKKMKNAFSTTNKELMIITKSNSNKEEAINKRVKDEDFPKLDSKIVVHDMFQPPMDLETESEMNETNSNKFNYLDVNSAAVRYRVQCNICNKTFCDKGALKIHFSAVHLGEMHKCTIEGCTMIFSSRRSRNRHSSNPNPRLHTPINKRRKKSNATAPFINRKSLTPHSFRYDNVETLPFDRATTSSSAFPEFVVKADNEVLDLSSLPSIEIKVEPCSSKKLENDFKGDLKVDCNNSQLIIPKPGNNRKRKNTMPLKYEAPNDVDINHDYPEDQMPKYPNDKTLSPSKFVEVFGVSSDEPDLKKIKLEEH